MLTLLRYLHPGSPRSRAKDQVMRELEARRPIVEQKVKAMMRELMAVVPRVEPLLWRKMSMKG